MVWQAPSVARGALGAAAVLVGGVAAAQSELHHFVGNAPGEAFGWQVALLSDVDGDGRADIAASSVVANTNRGALRVFSGATGSLLWQAQGSVAGTQFGNALAALGDVDGDGRGDVAVGAHMATYPGAIGAGMVRVYSGATGALLREHRGDSAGDHFGWSVGDAGDVDGDGVRDLVAGAVDDDNGGVSSGTARVHSGATGAALWTVAGTAAQQVYGWSVAGVGDVDGDGRGEVLVGGPYFATSLQSGLARLHSGATGAVLQTWTGLASKDSFGCAVAGPGDVDGDGAPDVLVGARQLQTGATGYARVFSGASGALVHHLAGDATHRFFGIAVSGAGDVDYDGRADLLAGTPNAADNGISSGIARLYSGASGAVLHDFVGAAANVKLGNSISGGLDVDGDASPDLAIGAQGDPTAGLNAGGVFVHKGNDVPPPAASMPLEADVLEVSLSQATVQQLTLDAGEEHAGARYVIFGTASGIAPGFEASGLTVPLNPDAYMLHLLANPKRAPLQGSQGVLDAEGGASATFAAAGAWRSETLVGRTFHHAYVVVGAGAPKGNAVGRLLGCRDLEALFVSNPVEVTVVP